MKKTKVNIIGPLTVAIAIITLGAAFGVLAGKGAYIGMVSTSVIALITALVSGSRYGVSSPTGPMTAAVSVILLADQKWLENNSIVFDANTLMNLTLIFAGIILFILVLLKVHRLIKHIPNLVVSGFVNGIALLIITSQIKSMNLNADYILMFVTLIIALLSSYLTKKNSHQVLQLLTSSLMTILVISAISVFFELPVSYLEFGNQSNQINLSIPQFSLLNFESMLFILPLAFELAVIALLDTILTAFIIDKKSRSKTKLSRELTGQSLALAGVSLFGGIPGAQSTVPTMMMHQEKANHKSSKLLLAAFCIIFTLLFSDLIAYVPLAVFGGIILKIAIDIADFTSIKSIFKCPLKQRLIRLLIIAGTAISSVLLSLNLAVIGFTLIFVLWNNIMPKKFKIKDLRINSESEGLSDEL